MRQWTVDAFADRPFRGNPACVVEPFDTWPGDAWMQALAEENKQAETAFLRRTAEPDRFELRWFTPALEVPLCGHATLASAHVLFSELGSSGEAVRFQTRKSGLLGVERAAEGYRMDFPATPATPVATPAGLAEALGVEPLQVLSSRFLLAILPDEASVRSLRPDLARIERVSRGASERGNVIVSAEADPGGPYRVVSRFFAPGSGIPEDPATGAAHCILAPVWAAKLGRLELDFHQAYPGRGGDLRCRVAGERVMIEGQAVTVIESRLRLQP
ncbi:PhzF family phenazine biosynthesis protein [Caulobacter sp. S45]|uniref:PhzF family phenazine biosynthesis protein n=1 Tax=Caulobacter sp. S45 TaxID=1641861 RepID=UPI001577382B|nr:PhzF family phenazine biosynthesis protein [Caulobacter sp. S45]